MFGLAWLHPGSGRVGSLILVGLWLPMAPHKHTHFANNDIVLPVGISRFVSAGIGIGMGVDE